MKIEFQAPASARNDKFRLEAEACTAEAIADAIARDVELRFGGYGPGIYFRGEEVKNTTFVLAGVSAEEELASAVSGEAVLHRLFRMEVTVGGNTLTVFQSGVGGLRSSKELAEAFAGGRL